MEIKGIKKGDKELRHFTFDDEDYVVRGGIYYYKVNYGKNKLEGEYAEDEIDYVECDKIIPLGGRKPKPIPGRVKKEEAKVTEVAQVTEPVVETPTKKRGRPPKIKELQPSTETISIAPQGGVQKYEYYVVELIFTNGKDLQDKLNELGDDGWELCGFEGSKSMFASTHIVAVFKRKRG